MLYYREAQTCGTWDGRFSARIPYALTSRHEDVFNFKREVSGFSVVQA